MNRLILGAGESQDYLPGLRVDMEALPGIDVVQRVPPLPDGGPWDEILAVHLIEHLPRYDAVTLIKECYQALAPGGQLILEQPDIAFCMRVFLGLEEAPDHYRERFGILGIFGEGNGKPGMVHQWGYTPDSLTKLFRRAGFETIQIERARYHHWQRDFRIVGVKNGRT
jgi:predicted SAM-dependent methyltransferase